MTSSTTENTAAAPSSASTSAVDVTTGDKTASATSPSHPAHPHPHSHHAHTHHGRHGHPRHRKRGHRVGCPHAVPAPPTDEKTAAAQRAREERRVALDKQIKDTIAQVRAKYTDIDPSIDDNELSRFVVARGFDVDATIAMHRKQREWRKTEHIDELPVPGVGNNPLLQNVRGFSSVPDGNFVLTAEGVPSYMSKWYNCLGGGSFHKVDNEGNPVFIERTGYHDVKGLGAKCPTDELLDWHVRNNEFIFNVLMKECSENEGRNVDKHVVIFDCQGLGLWQFDMKGMSLLKALSALDSKVYPERLSKLFIVNTPSIFSKAWSLIKGWLDPGILEKIFICGSDYKEVLLKHIPAENLPAFLGGKCLCKLPGGCVPSPYLEAHGGQSPDFMSSLTLQAKHTLSFKVPKSAEGTELGIMSYKFRSSKKGVVFDLKYESEPNEKQVDIVKAKSVSASKDIIEDSFRAAAGNYIFSWERPPAGFSLFGESIVLDYTVDYIAGAAVEAATGPNVTLSPDADCECWKDEIDESSTNVTSESKVDSAKENNTSQ